MRLHQRYAFVTCSSHSTGYACTGKARKPTLSTLSISTASQSGIGRGCPPEFSFRNKNRSMSTLSNSKWHNSSHFKLETPTSHRRHRQGNNVSRMSVWNSWMIRSAGWSWGNSETERQTAKDRLEKADNSEMQNGKYREKERKRKGKTRNRLCAYNILITLEVIVVSFHHSWLHHHHPNICKKR